MVPSVLLHFDGFPVLGNAGKLDRKAIKLAAWQRLGLEPAVTDAAGSASDTVAVGT